MTSKVKYLPSIHLPFHLEPVCSTAAYPDFLLPSQLGQFAKTLNILNFVFLVFLIGILFFHKSAWNWTIREKGKKQWHHQCTCLWKRIAFCREDTVDWGFVRIRSGQIWHGYQLSLTFHCDFIYQPLLRSSGFAHRILVLIRAMMAWQSQARLLSQAKTLSLTGLAQGSTGLLGWRAKEIWKSKKKKSNLIGGKQCLSKHIDRLSSIGRMKLKPVGRDGGRYLGMHRLCPQADRWRRWKQEQPGLS